MIADSIERIPCGSSSIVHLTHELFFLLLFFVLFCSFSFVLPQLGSSVQIELDGEGKIGCTVARQYYRLSVAVVSGDKLTAILASISWGDKV